MNETEDRLGAAMGNVKQAKALPSDANRAINAAQAERAELRRENERLAEPQLPDGVKWPRFEDGELVSIGDEIEHGGKAWTVTNVGFATYGWDIDLRRNLDFGAVRGSYGERLNRPAKPVIDADGVPIEVGDTVFYDGRPEPLLVCLLFEDATGSPRANCSSRFCSYTLTPSWLSHTCPDSWKQLEEDANMVSRDYVEKRGLACDVTETFEAMTRDLVRRAKKLAKAGE
mgnify:CR=1 FL=1